MIIGLVGLIGSGKGTVGDILEESYGFKKQSFAGPLKDATATVFNWPRHLLEGDTPESREWRETVDPYWTEQLGYEVTPRLAMQKMGTEAGRDVFGDKIWVTALKSRIDNDALNLDHVITDVRFPNEIDIIREWGGKVYRVKRGEDPEWYETARIQNTSPKSVNVEIGKTMEKRYPEIHVSEWAWAGADFDDIIENDLTIDDLKSRIEELFISKEIDLL